MVELIYICIVASNMYMKLQRVFFIQGLCTAKQAAAFVAVLQRCPLYSRCQ